MVFIAGIGSRQSPEIICSEMVKIGRWAASNGHTIRSGHADGADYAFETGAQKSSAIYLPWPNFNSQLPMLGQPVVVPERNDLDTLVNKFHPAPERLTRGARALMRRNGCQVLGFDLNEPAAAVVCWQGKTKGGTQQAISIAIGHGIPVLNMADERFDTAEKVIAELVRIIGGAAWLELK